MQTPTEPDFFPTQYALKIADYNAAKDKSPELGALDIEKPDINYNKRTGRPIRKSAGRRSVAAGMINWFENGSGDPWSEQDFTEDLESSDNERPKKKVRTKRQASPPIPPLSPMMNEDYPTPDSSPPPDIVPDFTSAYSMTPLTLSFHLPPSFQGGTVNINLDLGSLLQQAHEGKTHNPRHSPTSPSTEVTFEDTDTKPIPHKTGFLDLPGELRNKVYRLAFVTPETIEFNGKSWARSGAFLATCRTVYEEGRSILYGENKFLLERTNKTRGNYFDAVHKEIGYKDVRRFFESIGPSNIALMRDLSFTFDDAMPSMTPYLSNNEERRFTYDLHLIRVLKLLGRHSRLRKMTMAFQGRRTLMKIDYRFLDALRTVKADEVRIVGNAKTSGNHYYWNPHPKITPQLKDELIKDLAREKKLYLCKK